VSGHTFYIVDVFAEEKYAGNQLAVVRQTAGLSTETMQRLAQEMHYSETTFIDADTPRDGGYDVRIFTPERELPFAGHPTLGTAYVIQREILATPVERVTLNEQVGPIPVTITYVGESTDVLWMQQNPPTFGRAFAPEDAAAALGLPVGAIDPRFPCQEVSTGLPFIIVPLQTLAGLRQARTDHAATQRLIAESEAKSILLFCPEPYHAGHDLSARMFADHFGLPEDPATGSANGCLAAYLALHRYFGTAQVDTRVAQGYEIGRPSLLYLRAVEHGEEITVSVGGKVVMVAQGTLV
jgi:trans-2,3-dihydro-3-hydroxyanthranilate isomerase